MDDGSLIEAYRKVHIPLDQLPYTKAFDRLRLLVERSCNVAIENAKLWRQLLRIRKRGDLPRLRR